MRSDMYKLLHERGRYKGRERVFRDVATSDGEYLGPTRIRMREQGDKEVSLRLAPLRRFVASQVGRPWAEVYAQLQVNLARRDRAFRELSDYLPVALNTYEKDGEVWVADSRGEYKVQACWDKYYVHPRTGCLMRTRDPQEMARNRELRYRRRQAAELARVRKLSDFTQLHLLDGVWYEIGLAKIPSPEEVSQANQRAQEDPRAWYQVKQLWCFDRVLGCYVYSDHSWRRRELYGKDGVYAKSKRQLSSQELKLHGLVNA